VVGCPSSETTTIPQPFPFRRDSFTDPFNVLFQPPESATSAVGHVATVGERSPLATVRVAETTFSEDVRFGVGVGAEPEPFELLPADPLGVASTVVVVATGTVGVPVCAAAPVAGEEVVWELLAQAERANRPIRMTR
jgi:hypothetical protein